MRLPWKQYVCQSKYGRFCSSPQVAYLHTKNEGGLKIFISKFASLSQRTVLNFLIKSCKRCIALFSFVCLHRTYNYLEMFCIKDGSQQFRSSRLWHSNSALPMVRPQGYHPVYVFVCVVKACKYKYSNFYTNCYCKYLESTLTAVYL